MWATTVVCANYRVFVCTESGISHRHHCTALYENQGVTVYSYGAAAVIY